MNDEDFIEDSYLDPSTENGSHTISPQERGLSVHPTLKTDILGFTVGSSAPNHMTFAQNRQR